MRRASQQRGAMFGLDARIALLIFTVLTLVSGYTGVKAYSQLKGQGFATELRAIAKGFSQLEVDLQRRVTSTQTSCVGTDCTQRDSYRALFTSSVINTAFQSRWHGPYITPQPLVHPEYGTGYVYYSNVGYTGACLAGATCYAWLSWGAVERGVASLEVTNALLDGANETGAATNGSFRWTDNGNGTYTVVYRLGRAIGS